MTAEGASRAHLYSTDGFHARRGLDQRRVARCFPGISNGILQRVRLLAKGFKLAHGACLADMPIARAPVEGGYGCLVVCRGDGEVMQPLANLRTSEG